MSELTKLRNSLAEALGENPEQIKATNPRWIQLMKEGVLITLHVGRNRAKSRLSWSDLGIDLSEEANQILDQIINLGHKNLLPGDILKELNSIESGARALLNNSGFKTYWGRFIPVTAYAKWKEDNEEFISRYFAKRDEITANYDNIIQSVLISYEAAARSSYERLKAMATAEKVQNFPSEGKFIKAFISHIRAELPSKAEIESSFYFDVELHYVPLPSLLAAEQAEAQRIGLEMEAEAARAWAERESIEQQLRAERDIQQAEVRAAQTAADVKVAMLEEMNRDIIEKARKEKKELVDDFLRGVVVQLRSLVYEATTDVLGKLQEKGSLHPRSIVQLKKMTDQVKSLNFYGDSDIESMLRKVEFALDQGASDRNSAEIESNLRDISTVIRASLIGLGESPRSARKFGVVDTPDLGTVRQARQALDLDIDTPNLGTVRQARLIEA